MTSTRIKARRAAGTDGREFPRKLWLAGLGAISLARREGSRMIETLADEGETFRDSAVRYANQVARDAQRTGERVRREIAQRVKPLRAEATRIAGEVSKRVDAGLNEVLARLGRARKTARRELSARSRGPKRTVRGGARKRAR
jgi:poly(hydroxyalkanoate) granule-associated protein